MLQQRPARLVELLQPDPPRLLVVVLPLRQRLARDVVFPAHPRGVEARVVHPAAGRVHPAGGDPSQDDVRRGEQGDDEVDGDQRVEAGGLVGCARESVEDEGCGGGAGWCCGR